MRTRYDFQLSTKIEHSDFIDFYPRCIYSPTIKMDHKKTSYLIYCRDLNGYDGFYNKETDSAVEVHKASSFSKSVSLKILKELIGSKSSSTFTLIKYSHYLIEVVVNPDAYRAGKHQRKYYWDDL